jgi:hypothetical protein
MVQYLLDYKKELGHWEVTVDRPPAEASHFTTNYVAVRGPVLCTSLISQPPRGFGRWRHDFGVFCLVSAVAF